MESGTKENTINLRNERDVKSIVNKYDYLGS